MVVAGLHITHLGLRSLREISDGDVFVSKNSELCYTDAKHWQKLFKSPHQTVNIEGNANATTCGKFSLSHTGFSCTFAVVVAFDYALHEQDLITGS